MCKMMFGERLKFAGSKGRRKIWALERRSGKVWQQRYSWPLPALSHWEVEVGGTSTEEMKGATILARD